METNNYSQELDNLISNLSIEYNQELPPKINDIKKILNTFLADQSSKNLDLAIASCFGVFEDDNFTSEGYAKGFLSDPFKQKIDKLRDELKLRVCAFLQSKIQGDETAKDIVSDSSDFMTGFFSIVDVSDEIKLATTFGLFLIRIGIDVFYNNYCK